MVKRKLSLGLHVTATTNLDSITESGLIPCVGPSSKCTGEEEPLIHLFTSIEALEKALPRWLGNILEDSQSLALLCVDLNGIKPLSKKGAVATIGQAICPSRITLVTADIDQTKNLARSVLAATQRQQKSLPGFPMVRHTGLKPLRAT